MSSLRRVDGVSNPLHRAESRGKIIQEEEENELYQKKQENGSLAANPAKDRGRELVLRTYLESNGAG